MSTIYVDSWPSHTPGRLCGSLVTSWTEFDSLVGIKLGTLANPDHGPLRHYCTYCLLVSSGPFWRSFESKLGRRSASRGLGLGWVRAQSQLFSNHLVEAGPSRSKRGSWKPGSPFFLFAKFPYLGIFMSVPRSCCFFFRQHDAIRLSNISTVYLQIAQKTCDTYWYPFFFCFCHFPNMPHPSLTSLLRNFGEENGRWEAIFSERKMGDKKSERRVTATATLLLRDGGWHVQWLVCPSDNGWMQGVVRHGRRQQHGPTCCPYLRALTLKWLITLKLPTIVLVAIRRGQGNVLFLFLSCFQVFSSTPVRFIWRSACSCARGVDIFFWRWGKAG